MTQKETPVETGASFKSKFRRESFGNQVSTRHAIGKNGGVFSIRETDAVEFDNCNIRSRVFHLRGSEKKNRMLEIIGNMADHVIHCDNKHVITPFSGNRRCGIAAAANRYYLPLPFAGAFSGSVFSLASVGAGSTRWISPRRWPSSSDSTSLTTGETVYS